MIDIEIGNQNVELGEVNVGREMGEWASFFSLLCCQLYLLIKKMLSMLNINFMINHKRKWDKLEYLQQNTAQKKI